MNLPRSTEDLQNLITNRVQESLHLDYKRSDALSQRNFKEASKDVSAFANADGGIIVYGIEEDKHISTRIDAGVDHSMMSRERLEQTITSNIAPKLLGLEIVQIPLFGTHSAFAISIPKSYRSPHQDRVTHRYYKRPNFSAEPMEDYEIADLRARAQTVPPLINLRPDVRPDNLFFLVIGNLAHHFWQSNCMKGISGIDGVDDEMVAAIRKYFDVSDDDV